MRQRAAGVLLHPSSIPGRFGIGDLGPQAFRFLDWLEEARQSVWQVLPLGPPGPGDSPYSSTSAFAGNTALLSPELLVEEGLLDVEVPAGEPVAVDESGRPAAAARWKKELAARALDRCRGERRERFEDFRRGSRERGWLDDWVLYAALKSKFSEAAWYEWPADIRRREPAVVAAARRELAAAMEREAFAQFLFVEQWGRLRREANRRGIRLFGDLPIYVALDSADVWSRTDLFRLDEAGRPRCVAGVPPDYFSPDGQLWGHPLYDWSALAADDFGWWVERLRWQLELCDLLRVDHFRGLVAFWEVPATATTAREGRWVEGPGADLFAAIERAVGSLPLVAEDLGDITPEVDRLRGELGLMGMKVLQFAFDDGDSTHLPHHHSVDTVVYTGTHDNDTSAGWAAACAPEARRRFADYAGSDGREPHWDLLRLAWTSVARLAIAPMQDVLGLGTEARMNQPARPDGNWRWRLESIPGGAARLARLTTISGRAPAAGDDG